MTQPAINRNYLNWLRRVGFVEALSTIVLFGIAMPLKYLAGWPTAVAIAGPIHGGLFILLVAMFAIATGKVPISKRLALAGIFGAILPFGPFVVDRWLARVGS